MNETETYVEAVKVTEIEWSALTKVCPECGEEAQEDDGWHVMIGPWVIVGCEGYWVIDPALVGIPRAGWEDWK